MGLVAALAPAAAVDAQCPPPSCDHPKYATGSTPLLLSGNADLNGDGYPDLTVANSGASSISVLRNNGNGTFASQVTYPVGNNPAGTVCADLNGDGHADVAATNGGQGGGHTISVLLNNGNGTLAAHVQYEVGFWPTGIAAVDLDNDGDLDLAVANISGDSVSVLINGGNGTFAPQTLHGVGDGPHLIVGADLDGDGDMDLATTNAFSDNVSVLLNNGNATFGPAVQHAAGNYPVYIVAADLDADGDIDLAAANQLSDSVSLLFNVGGGAFATQVLLPIVGSPTGLAAADLDLDGYLDLATAAYASMEMSIRFNEGDGTFPADQRFCMEHSAYGLTANDLNLDGVVDLAVTNFLSQNSVAVVLDVSEALAGGESCLREHPEPGCGDQACCKTVCAFDSSCCDTAWDANCVEFATELCGYFIYECPPVGGAPVNNCATNATTLPPRETASFDTTNATTDGPPTSCPSGKDIWYVVQAPADGELVVAISTPNWDSTLSIYALGGSPVVDGDILPEILIGCVNSVRVGDEVFTYPSAIAGDHYLIQVAGFDGGVGADSGFGEILFLRGESNCPGNDFSPGGCVLEYLEEPCGTDTNGGCNSVPAIFTDIQCGDDVCGDFWALGGVRDTDFYRFTLDAPAVVNWEVYADIPVSVILLSANSCTAPFLDVGVGDCPTVAIADLCPGTYWAFVAPLQFEDLPCAEYYNAKLTCTPFGVPPYIDQCCGNTQAGSCVSAHPTPFCDNSYCCEVVCSNDPHCCTTEWDGLCVQRAAAIGCGNEALLCPGGGMERAYICEAGCRDEFDMTNGLEPASGQPGCVAFDVIPVDGCFRHTFTGCWPSCAAGCGPNACGTITGAFLEIRFQEVPVVGPPPEFVYDFVAFYDQGSSTALGVTPIVGLNTVTLDLSNLPGSPFDILSTLCDGELSVAVVDDTAVDYMALTIIHCPCDSPFRPLFERDDPGDFTTPSPTNASQALQDAATCSSGALTSYDVAAVNQCFVETIDLAPYTCVLDGFLRICVVPTSAGYTNDALALELLGPFECGPSAFAWGMSLANLEALGYVNPPLAQGQVSCIELFLDDLPPSASGVRDISSHLLDGSLDILIQDDTGVTSVFFGPQVCECKDVFDCTGDLTGDEVVNGADLGILLGNWGGDGEGDFNGDDVVDGADLGVLLGSWGECP